MQMAAVTYAERGATVPTLIVVMVMIIIRSINYSDVFWAIPLSKGIRTGYPCQGYEIEAQYIAGDFHFCKNTD